MAESETAFVKRVVLLVDNAPPIIDAATMMLEGEGFHVCSAPNCDEAIAHIGRGFLPDIVMTDYRLPGPNGIEVVKRVRKLLAREVPALLMTGDTSAATIRAAKVANLGVLRKPFQIDKLFAQIDEALASLPKGTIPPTPTV